MAYRNYADLVGYIVRKDGNGDFTTISAALTAASTASYQGDIIIGPGTYTEDCTLVAGVNLVAFQADAYTFSVVIVGKCLLTTAGTVSISGISLRTNSNNNVAVTGSAASVLILIDCYLDISNNNGIVFSSSNASSQIRLFHCWGNLGTTGIKCFAHTGAGTLFFYHTEIKNSGATTNASTISGSGELDMFWTRIFSPITTSSTCVLAMHHSFINTSATNTLALTIGGSGSQIVTYTNFITGSGGGISISSTGAIHNCWFDSTATDVITGAGTLDYSGLQFLQGSTNIINVTTQVGGLLVGGTAQAPSAGFIGEQLTTGFVSNVAVTTSNTAYTIATLNITPGIWDVSGNIAINSTANSMSAIYAGVNTTAASTAGLNFGDDGYQFSGSGATFGNTAAVIPAYRVVLTSTTSYYLVAEATFGSGTIKGAGRLSATRVG